MGTADAEILSTQRFQSLSLLRNDVHLEDCHAPYNTCEPVDSYRKRFRSVVVSLVMWVTSVDCCWGSFPFLSRRGVIVGGRIKGGWGPERRFAKEVGPPGSHSNWGNNNSNENMFDTYYAIKCTWNGTSHPKSVHVYLLSHQTIPAIQSNNNIIPTGHPQDTIKPHVHSVSISIVIFHTAHRATGSTDWGGDNKKQHNAPQHTRGHARAATDKCTSKHTRTHTHTHVRAAGTHTYTHTCARAHPPTPPPPAHTHTHRGKRKTDYSVAGEGVTKHAASGPFGTFQAVHQTWQNVPQQLPPSSPSPGKRPPIHQCPLTTTYLNINNHRR